VAYVIAIDIGGPPSLILSLATSRPAPSPTPKARPPMIGWVRRFSSASARLRSTRVRASFVKHGTTLVINALLQRVGAKTALLATKGFRDLLEIGRGNRTRPFDLRFHREPPLIPRELRFDVTERVRGSGQVQTPLAVGELKNLADKMRDAGVEALAISFLNSYLTPDHEQAAAAEMRRLLPEVFVTTGTELTREWHDSSAPRRRRLTAYVGPQVSKYIAEFDSELRQGGLYRIAIADGVARRRDFGRARLPRADHARGVRSGRRLHRRGELRPSARRRQSRRLRHGRHHGEMRDDRARPLCGGIDLSYRRA